MPGFRDAVHPVSPASGCLRSRGTAPGRERLPSDGTGRATVLPDPGVPGPGQYIRGKNRVGARTEVASIETCFARTELRVIYDR